MRRIFITLAAALVAASLTAPAVAAGGPAGAVFTQTNAAAGNEVVVYARAADGSLTFVGNVATGGTGSGAGLGSQGAVTLADNGKWLYVVNAGSNSVTTFRVTGTALTLTDVEPSGGVMPTSVTADGDTVYVLNAGGSGNIAGFRREHGDLSPIAGSVLPLSSTSAGGAQIGFAPNGRSLVVTEKATNRIDVYPVGGDGVAGAPTTVVSPGTTPFGFAFAPNGTLVVSEAATGSASSYRVQGMGSIALLDPAVPNFQAAACWFVVTDSGRFAYTTNTGSGNISGYHIDKHGQLTLLDPSGVTASTGAGSHPTDEALSKGRYLYVLAGGGSIAIFHVEHDGSLTPMGFAGTPVGVAGIAAD